ncbi:MAG: prevent-host-death protein [Deltaproteobacteria bacterium]|nr:MAG: prevent-host-death protein [Deltaproteobacteria bacterium]
MAKIRISEDIVTVSDFKAQASEWLRQIAGSGHPLVITQNGKPAGVLLSPAAFDELSERQEFLAAVQEGMADEQAGRSHTTDDVFSAVEERIAAIESQ